MTDYRDGHNYIWTGGDCPVHPNDRVLVWFRGYRDWSNRTACLAGELDWHHPIDSDDHIVAFQVSGRSPDDPRDEVIKRLMEALTWVDANPWAHPDNRVHVVQAALTFAKEQLK